LARELGRLSAVSLRKINTPGLYPDGGGLYLQVTKGGARTWVYRFMLHGRAREMGLGPLHIVGLAEAREKARECRKLRHEGIDPIEARKARQAEQRLAEAGAMTFRECAERYIEAQKAGWKNPKHAKQWPSTLETYVYPVLGALPVQAIDVGLVMKVLEPIWNTKPETAGRVRGRIEAVLDWAKARGYRNGENPAQWRGHLDNLLPARSKVRKVEHHPALPYGEMGDFIARLREQEGIAARALEFLILTASRTGEVIGARWDEFDLEKKVWTVPGERMKAGKEHRVPLSDHAFAIIEGMKAERVNDHPFVFPGGASGEAPLEHGDAPAPPQNGAGRADHARVPVHLPGLGCRVYSFPGRGGRNGLGAYRER
jgi:integrase